MQQMILINNNNILNMIKFTCIVLILITGLIVTTYQEKPTREELKMRDQAREQRLKQIQRRRKQAQQRMARQKQQANGQKAAQDQWQNDESVTKTATRKINERNEISMMNRQTARQSFSTKEFLFEIDRKMEQFVISLPSDQRVFLFVKVYVVKDNVYSEIEDVEKDSPVRVEVFENNVRLVAQKDAYFEGAMKFNGRKDSTYTIRFQTSVTQKLISIRQNYLVESQHVEGLLQTSDAQKHAQKTRQLSSSFKQIITNLERDATMTKRGSRKVNRRLKDFFIYQIVQSSLCVIVCFSQIYFIKRLLRGQSIV